MPDDMAGVAAFLASDDSRWVTGQFIARSLCWLAFLLTGDWNMSIEAVIAVATWEEATSTRLASWVAHGLRRLVTVAALSATGDELRQSARRTGQAPMPDLTEPTRAPIPLCHAARTVTRSDLSQALLAIDLFPRCALLLTVFEEYCIDDAAQLLGADEALVRKACALGAVELTRNILLGTGCSPRPR
jgi:hypothetical protein